MTGRPFVAFALACALLPAFPRGVAADAPVPLHYKAYDGWNAIRTPRLSDDGRFFAYALTPEDGDPTLVVRDIDAGSEKRENRGTAPAFAADAQFVVFTHAAAKKDVDAAKKAKKPESQLPKNGVGILDLRGTKPAEIVDDVKTIVVAKDGGPVIAYRAEPSPSPSGSPAPATIASPAGYAAVSPPPKGEPRPQLPVRAAPTASTSPGASPSPVPSTSPSASPAPKADKAKEPGSLLTIRDLASGKRITAADSTEVAVSDDDRFIAYATETHDGRGDGMHVYDVAGGVTTTVLSGNGRYRNIALARDGSSLAFLSDVATYASDVPHDALYVVDLRVSKPVAVKVVDAGTPGLESGTTPSANGTIGFSRDARHLLLGTAPAPTPIPSGTPTAMAVDLWSWNDDVLQSQQMHDADQDRKRTYLAAYDVAGKRFAQLASPSLRDVTAPAFGDTALGRDDRAYRRASSWLGEQYADVYAVSIEDGGRRLLAKHTIASSISPGGRYALAWDQSAKHWVATRTADGKRAVLGEQAGVAFHNVEDDHPQPPQPYGEGGWIDGDRGVLLYDQYDVWLANPDTGAASNLTRR